MGDPDYNTPATGVFGMWIGNTSSPATCTLTSSDWAAIAVEVVSASTTNYETALPKYPDRVVLGKPEVVVYGDQVRSGIKG
jgi:hypothetical protein